MSFEIVTRRDIVLEFNHEELCKHAVEIVSKRPDSFCELHHDTFQCIHFVPVPNRDGVLWVEKYADGYTTHGEHITNVSYFISLNSNNLLHQKFSKTYNYFVGIHDGRAVFCSSRYGAYGVSASNYSWIVLPVHKTKQLVEQKKLKPKSLNKKGMLEITLAKGIFTRTVESQTHETTTNKAA
jgi:hypothetical protein